MSICAVIDLEVKAGALEQMKAAGYGLGLCILMADSASRPALSLRQWDRVRLVVDALAPILQHDVHACGTGSALLHGKPE